MHQGATNLKSICTEHIKVLMPLWLSFYSFHTLSTLSVLPFVQHLLSFSLSSLYYSVADNQQLNPTVTLMALVCSCCTICGATAACTLCQWLSLHLNINLSGCISLLAMLSFEEPLTSCILLPVMVSAWMRPGLQLCFQPVFSQVQW